MMQWSIRTRAVCAGSALLVCAVAGADEQPFVWEPEVSSVAVFKNGHGFFVAEGDATLRDGWCVGGEVPPAAFGTFLTYATDPAHTVDIVGAGRGEVLDFEEEDGPAARMERLAGWKGLQVEMHHGPAEEERVALGTLIAIGDGFAVLESAEGNAAVPLDGVRRARLADMPLRVHVAEGEGDAAGRVRLGQAYLRGGITWVPEYTLRVIDEESAELTLRGTLINEAQDLVNCDVRFVVGAPNFAHAAWTAPLAMGTVLKGIAAGAVPQEMMSQISNAALSNTLQSDGGLGGGGGGFGGGGSGFGGMPTPGTNPAAGLPMLDGPAASDYTAYVKRGLTVRQGERAMVTLFSRVIRYEHIYALTVGEGGIRHHLQLENDTDTAWTTGGCLALSAMQPLSEDTLKYTPRGSRVDFPVTAAVNLTHTVEEREADREFKAFSIDNREHLDRVMVEGTVTLNNYEAEAVRIEVRLPVHGRPLEASHDGELEAFTTELKLSERRGRIDWTVEVPAGEERKLTYRYERFVGSG